MDDQQPLPTPRALLTSLLTTLFTSSNSSEEAKTEVNTKSDVLESSRPSITSSTINVISQHKDGELPSNPLKSLPSNQKALLSTLHVLFPPPTLLQALDLLDRGLVTRIVWTVNDEQDAIPENSPEAVINPALEPTAPSHAIQNPTSPTQDSHNVLPEAPNAREIPQTTEAVAQPTITVYQVRSSTLPSTHPTRGRPRDYLSSLHSTPTYTVHLSAWNCSCAAFAFSAFPYLSSTSETHHKWRHLFPDENHEESDDREELHDWVRRQKRPDMHRAESSWGAEEKEWEFGGLSGDGKEGEGAVPICKHLLAVLLGEKWDVLKGYILERKISGERGRDEIAGLIAGG